MKKFIILSLLMAVASTTQAQAYSETESCQGKTIVPRGEFSLTVENGPSGPASITVHFHNEGLNEDFVGTFQITGFQAQSGEVLGKGVLRGSDANIAAGIQGSLSSNDQPRDVQLAIYTRGDHRIEYGYGLWLSCDLSSEK